MKPARKLHEVERSADASGTQKPLASWYTPGFSDSLGDRLLMFDNSSESSLELLRFNPRFGGRQSFEKALRERVDLLSGFDHSSIARVRAVEWLGPNDGLALVSNHTPGRRLSEVLHDARGAAFAMELVRQLTPVLAALQQQGPGIAHGALTADRIIVTPEGRLVLIEHVLGSAIESLDMGAMRLRHELGIAVGDANGRLDSRNDVVQLGLVALSLLLGRRIEAADYPDRGAHLLAEFAWGHRGSSAGTQLLVWLERALQLSDRRFESARDAQEALNEFADADGFDPARALPAFRAIIVSPSYAPAADHAPPVAIPERTQRLEALLHENQAGTPHLLGARPPEPPTVIVAHPLIQAPASAPLPIPEISADPGDVSFDTWAPSSPELDYRSPEAAAVAAPPPLFSSFSPEPEQRDPVDMLLETHRTAPAASQIPATPRRQTWFRTLHLTRTHWVAIILATLALIEAVMIGSALFRSPARDGSASNAAPPPAPPAATTPAPVASDGATPPVAPAGTPAPNTPTAASPTAASAATTPVVTPAPTPVAVPAPPPVNATRPVPAGTPAPTRIEVTSDPAGARVTIDGTARGVTPLTINVTAGRHTVVVSDGTASSSRTVNVAAGSTAAVLAAFAPAGAAAGWVTITSPIELQVLEGGVLLGTTGVARLMLPAGKHDLTLASPALGFQTTSTVEIQPGKTTATTITVPTGSISINALPWANVSIDGRSLGTTPIANLDIALGAHEVVWRHPQLGERKQTVIVTAKAPLRLMMDFNK
jgi:hypothetical protein